MMFKCHLHNYGSVVGGGGIAAAVGKSHSLAAKCALAWQTICFGCCGGGKPAYTYPPFLTIDQAA